MRVKKKLKWEKDCIITKFIGDNEFEYGLFRSEQIFVYYKEKLCCMGAISSIQD